MLDFWKPLRRGLLAVAVLGLAGCDEQTEPLSPEAEGPATVSVNGVQLVRVTPAARGLFLANGTTAQRVSALTGATITNSDATLIVPPGAVPSGVTITMKAEDDGFVTFRFGPNGLLFDSAATLVISAAKANLAGIDLSQLRIAGASDDQDDWQVIGGVYDPVSHTVSVPILHFSRYALCTE